jgi:hypothetical protein
MMYANEVATLVYRQVSANINWSTTPDGIEVLTLPNGYIVGISDDGSEGDEGISWWAYDPEGQPIESDGWATCGPQAVTSVEHEIKQISLYIDHIAER